MARRTPVPQRVRTLKIRSQAAYDVAIVGAGPAGLSAALVLGRCNRRVLLIDDGTPRSYAAHHVYGFLTRDGTPQDAFRALGHQQLRPYRNVQFHAGEVTAVSGASGRFRVRVGTRVVRSRKVLLATGVYDTLPDIPGVEAFFGRSVLPCPYCDGWEALGRPLAVYGVGERGFDIARALSAWTDDLVLCTNGPSRLTSAQRAALGANRIEVIDAKISGLIGSRGRLRAIAFADGRSLPRDALFFDTPSRPQAPLAARIGCQLLRDGRITCNEVAETNVPGLFAAGNIVKSVQLSIVAAGDGARAAFGINRELTREDFDRPKTSARKRRMVDVH